MPNMTQRLLAELNLARGLAYRDQGYSYWADVKGDGTYSPRIWTITNANGGVTLSDLNSASAVMRCNKIRAAIKQAKGN